MPSLINGAVPEESSDLISAPLRNNFATAYSEISDLQSRMDTAVAGLTTAQTALATAQNDIVTAQNNITALQQQVADLIPGGPGGPVAASVVTVDPAVLGTSDAQAALQALDNEIANIQLPGTGGDTLNFNLTEQNTGARWLPPNRDPIYIKTVVLGNLALPNQVTAVPHGITGLTQVISIDAVVENGGLWHQVPRANPGVINVWVDATNICAESGAADRSTWRGWATIRYTRLP